MFFETFTKHLPAEPAFRRFRFKDQNPLGGTVKIRTLYAPNDAMREVHRRLIEWLRRLRIRLPYATGAKPRCSPRLGIRPHQRNRYFYLTDIASAYPSVDGGRLAEILYSLVEPEPGKPQLDLIDACEELDEVVKFLKAYCLAPEGGLATGAPASPDLFNLYAGELLDPALARLAKQYGLKYTRYLDDLTFSSPKVRIGKRKRDAIRAAIISAGFRVNHKKSGVYDLRRGPILIHGIGLASPGRIFLPRHYLRKAKGLIHAAMAGRASRSKVDGVMGVFAASTDSAKLNRTERRLVDEYRRYCESRKAAESA